MAKVVLAAMSYERRAAATVDTPAESVDVVADELDGREAALVVDPEHASLSRQAYSRNVAQRGQLPPAPCCLQMADFICITGQSIW